MLRIGNGGEPGSPITITSAPGGRATLRGRVWVTAAGHDVIVQNVVIDGRNPKNHASPQIEADRVTFRGNEVTNAHTGICFLLGQTSGTYAASPSGLVIEGNRIHDCGRLPRTNHDHGIYVESTRGARIVGNWIYDNADRGVQLYPDAQGTLVERNVIDGNGTGVQFGGSSTRASSGNTVRNNTITNSEARGNIEGSWFGPVGTGNVAVGNCLFRGSNPRGNGNIGEEIGFDASGNLNVDPGYSNREAKDFSVRDGSPCADKVPARVPGPQSAPASGSSGGPGDVPPGGSPGGSPDGSSARAEEEATKAGTRYGVTVARRFTRGRWLHLRLRAPEGSHRSVITRRPRLQTRDGRRVARPSGSVRVPLPRRNGRVIFTVRFRDTSGKALGGDRVRVIVDRRAPRAGVARLRPKLIRLVARDSGRIAKIKLAGPGYRKILVPRRARVRIGTRLRVPTAKKLNVVIFDRAGNARRLRG